MTQKKQKTHKLYISEIDKRLAEFEHTHAKTASEQGEINKHRRVFELRDHIEAEAGKKESLWD